MRIQPWNLFYLAGLMVYIAIRGVFGARTKHNERIVSRVDWGDRALMGVVFIGNVLLPALYLATSWIEDADYRLPAFIPWAGTAVMVMALWLFWRAHADLGVNWSITLEMRKDHELIVRGVYRTLRHPMYAAIFLFAIAQGLLLQNWLAGWSGFVSFTALYLFRVSREEKMMRAYFGESYDQYVKQTGRLWPKLSGRSKQ